MIKRPSSSDTFEDVLEQQKQFVVERAKNPQFAAAAIVKSVQAENSKKSLFARSRQALKAETAPLDSIVFGDIQDSGISSAARRTASSRTGKSIYAQSAKKSKQEISELCAQECSVQAKPMEFDSSEILANMSEPEILAAQQEVLGKLNTTLVDFIKQRGASKNSTPSISTPSSELAKEIHLDENNAAAQILQLQSNNNWLHFNKVETEKLEWLTCLPQQVPTPRAGEQYEARFDWKGVMLPHTVEQAGPDLYLHGDEPLRPGYTLQELFRLARSNILQQRIAACGAILGILRIYQQGFYDGVCELPLSKIFFLLRFGFDENVPSILEEVAQGLSELFYNECDEHLLDVSFETGQGHWQPLFPVMEQADALDEDGLDTIASVQQQLSRLMISKKETTPTARFNTHVNETDDEQSKDQMTDFHLAETDLIACLLRTNILKRIHYILHTLRPEHITVNACLKILIRLARYDRKTALKIINDEQLLQCLQSNFAPKLPLAEQDFYVTPNPLMLKLLRVLAAHGLRTASLLQQRLRLDEILHSYLNTQGESIKLQIEALRLLRTFYMLNLQPQIYEQFQSMLHNLLIWHFQHLEFNDNSASLRRQHASAVLFAIAAGADNIPSIRSNRPLNDLVHKCCCKWFYSAKRFAVQQISQFNLLGACLHASIAITRDEQIRPASLKSLEFQQHYLIEFIQSESYTSLLNQISKSSMLLSSDDDRRTVHKPLPNLGSVIVSSRSSPHAILATNNPIHFLDALNSMCKLLQDQGDPAISIAMYGNPANTNIYKDYLERLSDSLNIFVATNYFARVELKFVLHVLNEHIAALRLSHKHLLKLANRLLLCLSAEFVPDIEQLFQNIIFNNKFLPDTSASVQHWADFYMEHLVFPHMIIKSPTELNFTKTAVMPPLLSADWPYFPLRLMLHHYMQNSYDSFKQQFTESQLIQMCLTFAQQLDTCLGITPTQKLIYYMIMFMGPDSVFLESQCDTLLRSNLREFFYQMRGKVFDFEASIVGLPRFETIYYMFVDHFQASSYGNDLFSALVMVPLAQNYDAKYRKRLWSDMGAALTYIKCEENLLINGLEAYLHPTETDESLLNAYRRAVHNASANFRNTIVYRIAAHHVQAYKNT